MSDKQWFETWFNTPYYHMLYCNRDENEARDFIHALINHLSIPAASRVLDVACGKGRHSRYLAEMGFDTTGIDLSGNSISEARLDPHPHLAFEVWYMRQTYRAAYFDLVVNLFSSFGYFDDQADDQAAIHAMAADLRPGGTLVMDYMNPEYITRIIKPRDIIDRGEVQFHIQKRIEGGFIHKQIDFLANGENYHYEEKLKIIKPEHFRAIFKEAGLTITAVYGDYALNPFDLARSPRQVIIATK